MKIKLACSLLFLLVPMLAQGQVTQSWVARFEGGGDDVATAVAFDAAGNVYVTGFSQSPALDYDFVTIKYDTNGNLLWLSRFNGPGNGDDVPGAIAVDAAGNVFVTGYSLGAGTGFDYATVSYDTNGVQRWVARFDGAASGDDFANNLTLDAAGNVYVTGGSTGIGTGFDYATVAYDTNGNQLWVAIYDGPASADDVANSIVVDTAGNVHVTGESMGVGTGNDYATVAYDPSGVQLWATRFNGPGNGTDVATGIAVDGIGNSYVTGYSLGGLTTGFDYATVAYDPTGALLWVSTYNGPGSSDDFAAAIVLDPNTANVLVTGQSVGVGTSFDYATVSYTTASGFQNWVARYNGPGNARDDAYFVAVDGASNVYVTGYSFGAGTAYDYSTVAYDLNGNQLWVIRYDGPASADDVALSVAVDALGNVYVTGASTGITTGRDFATIKYTQP
jgi:hypothetical protein